MAEVAAEARLHKAPGFRVEGLTRQSQHFMDDRWDVGFTNVVILKALGLQAIKFIAWLLRPALGASSAAGTSALELWLGHAHYIVGHAICFLLVDVSRGTHH
jgi:hypothetical protein